MIPKLTKEQGIIVTGWTGYLSCKWADFQADAEKRLGRPVSIRELTSTNPTYDKLRQLYRDDFVAICAAKTMKSEILASEKKLKKMEKE